MNDQPLFPSVAVFLTSSRKVLDTELMNQPEDVEEGGVRRSRPSGQGWDSILMRRMAKDLDFAKFKGLQV